MNFPAEERGRVLHDIRSSKTVTERIAEPGDGLTGHNYFCDCDSGILTAKRPAIATVLRNFY